MSSYLQITKSMSFPHMQDYTCLPESAPHSLVTVAPVTADAGRPSEPVVAASVAPQLLAATAAAVGTQKHNHYIELCKHKFNLYKHVACKPAVRPQVTSSVAVGQRLVEPEPAAAAVAAA